MVLLWYTQVKYNLKSINDVPDRHLPGVIQMFKDNNEPIPGQEEQGQGVE